MKKLLTLCLLAVSLCAVAQQKKVAVYVTGNPDGKKRILADKLVEGITYSNKFMAIERTSSFLAELKKEQNYQGEGDVDDNEISRLGKQFGVNFVCAVDVIEEYGQKYITARLIDVETAQVSTTGNCYSALATMEELIQCAQSIATTITGKTAQEIAEEEKAKQEEEKAKQKEEQEQQERISHQRQMYSWASRYNIFYNGYMKVGKYMVASPIHSLTWDQAIQTKKTCKIGGYNDWNIPTVSELGYIIDAINEIAESISKGKEEYYYWMGEYPSCSKKIEQYHAPYHSFWVQKECSMWWYNKSVGPTYSGEAEDIMLIRIWQK